MIGQSSGKAVGKDNFSIFHWWLNISFPSLMDSMAPLFMENARQGFLLGMTTQFTIIDCTLYCRHSLHTNALLVILS